MRRGRARRPRERQSARGRTPEAEPGVAQRREPRRAVPVLGGGVYVCSPAAPSYRARPSVYSVSRRRPGRSTCRFHRLHRIDIVIEARAAQSTVKSTDPIVYAVAPVPGPACVVRAYSTTLRIGRDEDRAVRGPGRVLRGGAVSSAEPADHAPGRPAPARGWTAAPFWLLQPYRAFRCLSRAVSSIDHA